MLLNLFDGLNQLQKKLNVNDFGTEAHVTRTEQKNDVFAKTAWPRTLSSVKRRESHRHASV
jgi:hypothetical protein